jgi:hypothetical protein
VPMNVAAAVQTTHRSTAAVRAAAIQARSESVIGKRATTRFPNSTNAWWSSAGKNAPARQPGQDSQPRPEEVRRTVAPLTTIAYSATALAIATVRNRAGVTAKPRRRARIEAASRAPECSAAPSLDAGDARTGLDGADAREEEVAGRELGREREAPLRRDRDQQATGRLGVVGQRDERV